MKSAAARKLIPEVELPEEIAKMGLELIRELGIASLRAEITLFEAARAMAAADGRTVVEADDLMPGSNDGASSEAVKIHRGLFHRAARGRRRDRRRR